MIKKVVVSVCDMCVKCRRRIMMIVAKFEGVSSISIDEGKQEVTVVGAMDPVCVVKALRKSRRRVTVVSIGEPEKKKPEEKPKEEAKPPPPCCSACRGVVVTWYEDPVATCSIL